MAIKIDLLPEYVPLRRKLKWTVSACVVTLGSTAAVLAVVFQYQTLQLSTLQSNVEIQTKVADQSRKATEAAAKATSDAAPKQGVVDFIYAASKTGAERAALLHEIREYIYQDAVVSSIDVSDGQTVKIQATVKDSDAYAAFLNTLRNGSETRLGPLYEGLPTASGVHGFPEGSAVFVPPIPELNGQTVVMMYPITVAAEGKLKNRVVLPVDPVGGSAPAAGTPGAPGKP